MTFDELDWEVLDRLRATFLSDTRAAGPYWHTQTDLACYDATYGERIGWKWDAVLAELRRRHWTPPPGLPILDWGCGSGVAGRRVLAHFGPAHFAGLVVHDHSSLALDYAEFAAHRAFPGLAVRRADTRLLRGEEPLGLLVVSHVVNELDEIGRAELAGLLARAQAVLWVEPGTHEVGRALGDWRARLLADGYQVVAPCTHAAPCGFLAPGNERHWCHHFAAPPPEIFATSDWVKFGQRAGIDLRALPYSFLVLDRRAVEHAAGAARILGEPRLYKGYAKLYSCTATGVEELTLQKRDGADLFKQLKRSHGPLFYRWTREGDRITAAEPLFAANDGVASQ